MNTKELEKRCNELFFQVNEKTERIAELEKENAELKEELKGKRCNCMTYLNFKDLEKQLTKAKEIIKKIEKIFYSGEIAIRRLASIAVILDEAEQFLSEVEK